MKRIIALLCGFIMTLAISFTAGAQSRTVSLTLKDSSNDEPVPYATVSITKSGAKDPLRYILSDDKGKASLEKVPAGKYVIKAELLGYKSFTKEITVKESLELGDIKMEQDKQLIDAASVSAVGNPIVIKKDTVEYNASSFKTSDNDVLEDLLKKLPGVEVGEDGSVTANGKSISKITIDGKTFFLDDPSLASKNIPAKMVEKVKVVQKKSEQAQFTGIDDGEEETVIDLSVQKSMMKGLFGNVMLGGGHDWLEKTASSLGDNDGDWRYQGSAFIGKFTDKSQLSIILNGNNTNNRGFNDMSGGMMRTMRGGGGMGRGSGGWGQGNGITSSWMGGLNGAVDLLDDKMELSGNYLYNNTKKNVQEKSNKTNFLDDGSRLIYDNDGYSVNNSQGHRFGARLEHKFSEKTSILFQPQFDFGKGNYTEYSNFNTFGQDDEFSDSYKKNDGFNFNTGNNNNWTTRGFFLFRQRLGIPGRTISANIDYNFSNNELEGLNQSLTRNYGAEGTSDEIVNQWFDQNSKSSAIGGRLVYTEPLGAGFYLEGNYQYRWSRNKSVKDTYDSGDVPSFDNDNHGFNKDGMIPNETYSNNILNEYQTHRAGVNFMYQKDKLRAQLGASVNPTITHNRTNGVDYNSSVVNWSPSAMLWYDINENMNVRGFYFGRSSQPSTSQLMPVPDNSNPLSVSLGNPYLEPYFNHNMNVRYGYTNKKNFFSINANIDGGLVQSPIVNASWHSTNGAQFSLPVNGPNSANLSLMTFLNAPIAKSNFSISNMLRGSWSKAYSYVGKNSFDTSKYYDDEEFDYEAFHQDFPDLGKSEYFTENKIQTMSITERFRLTYRNKFVELTGSGRTRLNKSWYTVNGSTLDMTRNNQISATMNWTIPGGVGLISDFSYNWYRGYTTPQDDEYILNVEINKLLFKKQFTLSLKAYDLLNQAKNLSISDSANYHTETWNNTLGRYVVLSLTWRFGTMNRNNNMGGPHGGPRGGRPGPPPML